MSTTDKARAIDDKMSGLLDQSSDVARDMLGFLEQAQEEAIDDYLVGVIKTGGIQVHLDVGPRGIGVYEYDTNLDGYVVQKKLKTLLVEFIKTGGPDNMQDWLPILIKELNQCVRLAEKTLAALPPERSEPCFEKDMIQV